MKKKMLLVVIGGIAALRPDLVSAAGQKASEIVVVADTRNLTGFVHYMANLYNENLWLFALWSVILTTIFGVVLGVLMDFVMKLTGLDLGKTRKNEH